MEDVKTVNNAKVMLTFGDKTLNVYKFPEEQYEILVNKAITTFYKKVKKQTQTS